MSGLATCTRSKWQKVFKEREDLRCLLDEKLETFWCLARAVEQVDTGDSLWCAVGVAAPPSTPGF